jgi:predicted secreted protein
MTLLLIIAVIVIAPWVAVVAVALAVLHQRQDPATATTPSAPTRSCSSRARSATSRALPWSTPTGWRCARRVAARTSVVAL